MEEKASVTEDGCSIAAIRQISEETLAALSLKAENNLYTYQVMLVDAQLQTSDDCQLLLRDLRKIVNENVLDFDSIELIRQFFYTNTVTKIFLIMSGALGEMYRDLVVNMAEIECTYIFCRDRGKHIEWSQSIPKIRGVFSNKGELLVMLSRDVKELANRWTFNDASSFLKASPSNIRWYHLFIRTLLHLPRTDDAREKMLNECRSFYRNHLRILQKIDHFESEYTPARAINYYTQDNFVYRIVNYALRTHSMDIVSKFCPYIGDLSEHLKRQHLDYSMNLQRNKTAIPLRVVFRGQYMDSIEVEQLRDLCRARQPDVLLNMFGSATRNPQIAMQFIQGARPGYISCFIQIIIPDYYYKGNLAHALIYSPQPFADISNFAQIPDEQEVLFSVMSHFRIRYVGQSNAKRSWIPIVLELFYDSNEFDPCWHQIDDIVRHESGEMRKELFKLMCTYADKTLNWDTWWHRLKKELGTRRRDCEPFVVTLYECFGDCESMAKAIELRKKALENDTRLATLSDEERFSFVVDEIKLGRPTRIIAWYELFFQHLFAYDIHKTIETLRQVGDAYAECLIYHSNALACYGQALKLAENQSNHQMIQQLQNRIKKLSSCAPHQKTADRKRTNEMQQVETVYYPSDEQLSNYEIEHLQWSTLWDFRKLARRLDLRKQLQIRLQCLHTFLKNKEEWIDGSTLRIFLNLPFQRNQNLDLLSNINQLFYSSIWSYPHEDILSFREHAFNQWQYEQFMNEWLTLNELKRVITHYVPIGDRNFTLILTVLERILKKLTVIIIMCTFLISVRRRINRHDVIINVNQINFLTDACIHPLKLIFFDVRDELTGDTVRAELERSVE